MDRNGPSQFWLELETQSPKSLFTTQLYTPLSTVETRRRNGPQNPLLSGWERYRYSSIGFSLCYLSEQQQHYYITCSVGDFLKYKYLKYYLFYFNWHMCACCSRCCGLVDIHALSTYRSRVLGRCGFSLPVYTRVNLFIIVYGPVCCMCCISLSINKLNIIMKKMMAEDRQLKLTASVTAIMSWMVK